MTASAANVIDAWPDESREAAQLVVDTYGEPDEATDSQLVWHRPGPWKRIVASRTFYDHAFPAPHIDAVESFLDYHVPPDKVSALAEFDGSVVVERTAGEVSARCHDEQANLLALNLMHDIVTGRRTPDEARRYYATEFLDARRKRPTPYMDELRFTPSDGATADPDQRMLSDDDLQRAVEQGEASSGSGDGGSDGSDGSGGSDDGTVEEPPNSTVDDWLGQQVDEDSELADRLMAETGGDVEEATRRFEARSHEDRPDRLPTEERRT